MWNVSWGRSESNGLATLEVLLRGHFWPMETEVGAPCGPSVTSLKGSPLNFHIALNGITTYASIEVHHGVLFISFISKSKTQLISY